MDADAQVGRKEPEEVISPAQRRILENALGGLRRYRNHYWSDPDCDSYADVTELVRIGLMVRYRQNSFRVTDAGMLYLGQGEAKTVTVDELVAMLRVVLDQVDYINGACNVTDIVGAVLPSGVIEKARELLERVK